MKDVTGTLEYEQTKPKQTYYKEVLLSRAEWNSGTNEYDWSTAINLDAYLIKINNVAWKLDSDSLNEWKVSNVTIEFDNREDIFDETVTDSIWDGYLARGSKIQIKAGNILPDATKETLYVFTGIIDKNVEILPEARIARLYVSGLEQMLTRADAENISTAVDDENMGTGDGTQTEFTTSNNGVGRIDEIKLDTTVQKIGVDYDVSQLNDPDNPAKITFKTAPTSGVTVYGDYIYWYQDKTFKWLIEELVKEAGIPDYNISDVSFPNNVINTWTEDQCAGEWNNGTFEAVECDTDKLRLADKATYTNFTNMTQYNYDHTQIDSGTLDKHQTYTQIKTEVSQDFHGYINILDASNNIKWTDSITNPAGSGSQFFTWNVDLSQWFSEGDTFKIKRAFYSDSGTFSWYDDLTVKWPGTSYSEFGKFISYERDCSASVASYGKVTYSASIPSGTELKFYTQSASSSGGPWDSEVEVGATGDILSDVKRYLRYVIYFDADDANGSKTPELDSISLTYYTSTFLIELANFTGLSCRDAIEELALMPDYEWGVNASGTFFFRSKETEESAQMIISESVNRIDLIRYDSGWNFVKNHIETRFGDYQYRINSVTEGDSRPHSIDKYGVRKLSISGGNLLGNSDVDIATGICQRFYDSYKNPKFRAKVRITFLPQLDLSDVISLPYIGLENDVWTKNFKVTGISLNLENYFIDVDLKEI